MGSHQPVTRLGQESWNVQPHRYARGHSASHAPLLTPSQLERGRAETGIHICPCSHPKAGHTPASLPLTQNFKRQF